MGNRHPTRHFCRSSILEGYICYIPRAFFAGWSFLWGSILLGEKRGVYR